MPILVNLLPASFRGVPFLALDSSMESGRKQVTHEYPNSDRRYVEDLGKFQNVYKINGLITGVGAQYFQRRNALIRALEAPGGGVLVHPFFGNVFVSSKQYTLEETTNVLGEAHFSLTFEKTNGPIVPQGNSNNITQIATLSDNALSVIAIAIGTGFSMLGNYPNNFTAAQLIIAAIAQAFGINTSRFTQDSALINDFNSLLGDYSNDTNNLILNPTQLGTSTMNLFTQTDALLNSPSNSLQVYSGLYNFYNDVPRVPPLTYQWIQRQNNNDLLASSVQAGALVQSYRNAPLVTYPNILVLNSTQAQLEAQYQALIQRQLLSDDVLYQLQLLRNQNQLFFNAQQLNVNNIVPVETNTQPLTTLVYQYYGDTAKVSDIANLNNILDPAFVSGVLNILSN